jgi:hypothetical protein
MQRVQDDLAALFDPGEIDAGLSLLTINGRRYSSWPTEMNLALPSPPSEARDAWLHFYSWSNHYLWPEGSREGHFSLVRTDGSMGCRMVASAHPDLMIAGAFWLRRHDVTLDDALVELEPLVGRLDSGVVRLDADPSFLQVTVRPQSEDGVVFLGDAYLTWRGDVHPDVASTRRVGRSFWVIPNESARSVEGVVVKQPRSPVPLRARPQRSIRVFDEDAYAGVEGTTWPFRLKWTADVRDAHKKIEAVFETMYATLYGDGTIHEMSFQGEVENGVEIILEMGAVDLDLVLIDLRAGLESLALGTITLSGLPWPT